METNGILAKLLEASSMRFSIMAPEYNHRGSKAEFNFGSLLG